MLDIQLGRRNLFPIQRIAVAEKYRPLYEKEAKENQSKAGKEYGNRKNSSSPNGEKQKIIHTDKELAKMAGVGTGTVARFNKVMHSDDEELKKCVQSGETSISAGYKELTQGKNETKVNAEKEINNIPSPTIKPTKPKTQISEETKQICADLKTEKTKEYLDSIWDYKVAIIECMKADFEIYYDGFVSVLNDMENRVTQKELNECIKNAENIVEKMLSA